MVLATRSPRDGDQKKASGGQGSVSDRPPPHDSHQQPGTAPSPTSLRGLDWFTFFVADVQTGFGPFVSVYLTAHAWTQVDIGLVLTVGGLVALICQIPGGAIVDLARSERFVAMIAVLAIAVSALAIAVWPIFPMVLGAQILHAAASCVLGPAIVAISLGLVGHVAIGERLGRNARFASIGNAVSAALMGATGYLLSNRAVFFFTAALAIPVIFALSRIRENEIDPVRAHGGRAIPPPTKVIAGLRRLAHNRTLLVVAACALLFHLANSAMLPLTASIVTMRTSNWATILIAACIVAPQIVVAVCSPWIGHHAQIWGRRPLLLIGFAALPIRGILLAMVSNPYALVAVQFLDGISGAVLAVMIPLVVADVTRGTGRFNLAQGLVGSAVGIGASLSTTLAGYMSDHF
ncbi:MAG TPA: MFS transporter, partial [Xanthobacteraceae bacterium]|nr:MFS transporter [Xanthobacteraceae bacterium]